ncbi:MAG: tetratricopeptide repeat protein [bacterium]
MRRLFPLLALPWLVAWSFFDPFHEHVEKGNRAAAEGKAKEAVQEYGEAAREDPGSPIPDFNRGLALAQDGDEDAARDAFLAAAAAEDADVAADALYNLGNLHLANQEPEPAIDSFLKSLDLDPNDPDTRRNLELALQMQEQQQQQQQQQQQDSDENQDGDEQEQDQQQPSEDPNQDQPPDDTQQDETPQDQNQDQQQEEEQQPQPSEEFSKEDAERLLNAVQSDELKVLEQLQPEQPAVPGGSPDDW